jgi:hypothetical protein
MNEPALHRIVQRRTHDISRSLARCYLVEITCGIVFGALMLVCAGALVFGGPAWATSRIKVAVTPWDNLALLVASGLWFHYGAYMYCARQRQLRREERFESTLRGDIERALAQTESQTRMARNIIWWGLIPLWLAAALWVLTLCHLVAAPPRTYLLMGATMAVALAVVVWGRQRAITCRYEPRQRELESLRSKLAEPRP